MILRTLPVAASFKVSTAPATLAPCGSVTVPRSDVVACANMAAQVSSPANIRAIKRCGDTTTPFKAQRCFEILPREQGGGFSSKRGAVHQGTGLAMEIGDTKLSTKGRAVPR